MAQDNAKWLVLLTVIVGTFLGRLDQTVVNLALPKIITDFSITVSEAGWIATAYILANAVFVPVWGKLGDTIGRKKVYLWGFGIFIVGSALAGLAWNLSSMIFFRVIQAIASSADYPTAMAIITVTFQGAKDRAKALGIWSSAFAASAVVGPLVGGPLIDNFGWRSVFLINIPVGLLGMAMAIKYVNESVSEKKTTNFDWWGAATLGASLSSLALLLDKGFDWGWTSQNSMLSLFAFSGFLYVFYRIDSIHPEPIVDFSFFKIGAFTGALINNFVVFMGMMGSLFLIPIFAQTFLGYGATQTGYLFIPMAFTIVLAAPLGASLVGKVEPRFVIAASTFIAAAGLLIFTGLDVRSTALDIIFPLMIMSFGLGFGMAQRTSVIASAVPDNEIGVASSILALARNIAGAFGIAVFSTILNNSTESNLLSIASSTTINTASPLVHGQVAGLIVLKATMGAYHDVFIVSAALLFIATILSFYIKVEEKKTKTAVFLE